jgi:hypothetical protein
MATLDRIGQRRAIEALRAGVPNRDAVQALGCAQPEIERRFREQLEHAGSDAAKNRMTPGMLVEGGFGTGKSHLFEYLQHVALDENFVCSKIVISKETPLYDPVKVYRAAIEAAVVPNKRGAALTEIAMRLNFNSRPYGDLYEWVHRPAGHLNARFAAMLFLYQRTRNDPELQDRVLSFWSGDQIGVAEIKKYLRALRETATYKIDKIPVRELALQRFKFTSRLMLAAGYAGWVLLFDEVELIGRYSLTQRAKSYAELARWLGKLEGWTAPGLTSVLAITDDFDAAILSEFGKDDLEKVPARMRAKATEVDMLLASQAERGMRLLERERVPLSAPDAETMAATQQKVRSIHAAAYDWKPPGLEAEEYLRTTRMREHVKGWITEWDLRRLYPEYQVQLETRELRQDYAEDPNLTRSPEEEPEDEAV